MIDWYRELNTAERRSFWACFGGWALDALDVQIYTFVVPALIALWHITNAQAGLLATSALVVSAFGGWIAGMLADRVGRARLLMITIAWFAFFTFLSGFTQNFEQLLIVRGLQGLGFGGEWAAGSVLIGEVIRAENRGKAVGTVQSAWAWGWGAAAILATIMFQLLPQAAPTCRSRRFSARRPRRRHGAARSTSSVPTCSRPPSSAPFSPPARRAVTTRSPPSCRRFCAPSVTSR
jgi:MFS family permease